MVVFVDSRTERDQIPEGLRSTYSDTGREDPRIMVSNSDASQGLVSIRSKRIKEDPRKAARELRKKLENVSLSASASQEDEKVAEEKEHLAPEQTWANHKGQEMTAAVVDLSKEKVTFLLPKGKEVPYDLSALSKESQERLEKLRID